MLRTKKGAQIEDAALKERRANRDRELFRMLANSKEIASFSEWLVNRTTLRTKKGARIEIASFSEWLANRKRCAQRKGVRMEIAWLKERRANRDRELFRMARE